MSQNKSEISNWVDLYSDELYSWASYKIGDSEMSKDLVQDTFIAATQAYAKFEGRSTPRTWLFSILNNKIKDYYRKNKGRVVYMADFAEDNGEDRFDSDGVWKPEYRPGPWEETEKPLLDDIDFRRTLDKCLNNLSDRFRTAVVWKFLEKKESADICQELNITPSNFWQILHRAKVQLRGCLDINWFKGN